MTTGTFSRIVILSYNVNIPVTEFESLFALVRWPKTSYVSPCKCPILPYENISMFHNYTDLELIELEKESIAAQKYYDTHKCDYCKNRKRNLS